MSGGTEYVTMNLLPAVLVSKITFLHPVCIYKHVKVYLVTQHTDETEYGKCRKSSKGWIMEAVKALQHKYKNSTIVA